MSLLSPMQRIWERRRILGTLVRRDLRIRYARSVLGYLWTLIDPLAMSLVFYLVFGVIFERREVEGIPFIVFLLCGLLPWNWFNNTINETARALYSERLLIRSTNLPREIWVVRVVISKGIEHLLSMPILIGFVAVFVALGHVRLNAKLFLILPALVVEFILLIGMGLVMAPVTALVDDFQRLVRIGLRVLFYLTPIIYASQLVAAKSHFAGELIRLNPLTGIAEMYREGLIVRHTPDWVTIGASAVIAVLWLLFGLWVFRRLERAVLKEI